MVGTAWAVWYSIEERRFREEVDQLEKETVGGFDRRARSRVWELIRKRPESSQAAYLLGRCEEAFGRDAAAMEAYERIRPGAPLYAKAAVARAWILIRSGRLTPAEELLASIPRDQSPDGTKARQAYDHLLRLEGRTSEARDLVVESWVGSPDPPGVLRQLYILDDAIFPVDYVKDALGRGDRQDDRVRLGLANLATWRGRFDEASGWLDSCLKRRPDDQPVRRAQLRLAMSSRDPDLARRAAEHLEAADFSPAEVQRLRAWFASFRDDAEVERRCLISLLAEEPANALAWARLAELSIKSGPSPEAEACRRKQAESIEIRERYAHLLMSDDSVAHAGELTRLAGQLGRAIEARGWSLIERGRAGTEPLRARPAATVPHEESRRSLASLVGHLLPDAIPHDSTIGPRFAAQVPAFVDEAETAGLRFFHDNGYSRGTPPPPEAMCGGVGLLDYDGDGWLDVYVVQGGPFPPGDRTRYEGDRLFHNLGNGRFEDATERSGIGSFPRGYGHGVAVGDYDNDGRPDLFITRWHSYALYRNRGDGGFEDVTSRSGLGGDRDWPTSAAFADLDGDGDLDLYVCHYLLYDPANPRRCNHQDAPDYCMPRDYPALRDHVFRNDGGRFVDVTDRWGFVDPDGRGLGVVAADLDDDNRIDLYVANDMSANYLFRNLGDSRFEEIGQLVGAAATADGLYKSGMGIACGDLDGDLALDLAVTNFYGESTTFFRNAGHGLFVDQTAAIGLQAPSRPLLGFGAAFADLNNDGWLDLITTNGHVLDSRPKVPWTMPMQLLVGGPRRRLTDISDLAGAPFQARHLGRGLAVGDLDNDGAIDVLVLNQNEPIAYLHNRPARREHFIRFRLEGNRSNRDGVGGRVTIKAAGRTLMAERIGGGSYQSASDPRLHFGLGATVSIDSIEVRWPSGRLDRSGKLAADRDYLLREGEVPREVRRAGPATGERKTPG